MTALNLFIGAVLLTLASANPDFLQQLNRVPNAGYSSPASSEPTAVRSGLIPSPDASAFETSSSSSGSSSAPLPGSSQSGTTLISSLNVDSALSIDTGVDTSGLGDLTITQETTVDVFKTVTNVIYNSIPITLTEFVKSTAVQPTLQVLSTPVDDNVFVATAPVTRTDSVTVTNTNTGYFYVTQVSTETYTITHKAYEILQKTITSTLQQTQVFRPTVVRTRISTERDTQTVEYLVTNTVVIQPRSTLSFSGNLVSIPRSGLIQDQQGFDQGLARGY